MHVVVVTIALFMLLIIMAVFFFALVFGAAFMAMAAVMMPFVMLVLVMILMIIMTNRPKCELRKREACCLSKQRQIWAFNRSSPKRISGCAGCSSESLTFLKDTPIFSLKVARLSPSYLG